MMIRSGRILSAADIDTGAKLGLNHPMGPLELSDLIGLDTVLAIDDVQQPVPGLYVHRGRVASGEAVVGQPVVGAVDLERRAPIH